MLTVLRRASPLLLALAFGLLPLTARAESTLPMQLKFYSEEYPPYNFQENGKPAGVAIELLDAMLSHIGSSQTVSDVVFQVWSRSYFGALNQRNGVVFSTTRTRVREESFKWVGPIADNPVVLVGKKSREFVVSKVDDLYQYRVLAVNDDVGETVLHEIQFPSANTNIVPFPEQAAKILEGGRADLWVYGLIGAGNTQKLFGIDPRNYQIVYRHHSMDQLYFAFNKSIPDNVIEQYQHALDVLKQKPAANVPSTYEKILQKYNAIPLIP